MAEPASTSQPGFRWALAALLFLVAAAAFWKSVGLGFVQWDDDVNIYNNPHLRVLDGAQVGWMFTDTDYARRYLPLGWLGWALNQHWFGLDPRSYHLGNVLLHAANTVLVFFLVSRLLWLGAGSALRRQPAGAWVGAALASLLWAVHPLRVESVAWASARLYSQAAFFLLVSILCHLRFLCSIPGAPGRWLWYGAGVGGFACSLLTYPIGLGALALYFVLDFFPFRRMSGRGMLRWCLPLARTLVATQVGPHRFRQRLRRRLELTQVQWDQTLQRWRRIRGYPLEPVAGGNPAGLWLEKIPLVAVALLILAVTLWSRFHSGIYEPPARLADFGAGSRLMQAFYLWAYYLWKPWVPGGLSPVYATLIDFDPLAWPFLLSLAAVAGLTLGLGWKVRRWPGWLALWVVYLALMAPVLGWTEHPHFAGDRYGYLPGVAWALVIGGGIWWLWQRSRQWMIVPLGAAVALFLSGLTQRQITIWEDSIVLHRHIIAGLGDHTYRHKIWLALGTIYQGRGDAFNAELAYRQVLAIAPNNADAHSNLADILADKEQFEEARSHYLEAIRIQPGHAHARQNLGIALAMREQFEEAAVQFQELLRYHPSNALAHHNLGLTLAKLGRLEEASRHRDQAQRLQNGPSTPRP